MKSEDNKKYPYPYDYWIDKETRMVYAIIEYDNKKIDEKHSLLYLISSKYQGNQRRD